MITTKKFIAKAQQVHSNKYNYSLTEFKGWKNKIKVICQQHGIFEPAATVHVHGKKPSGCPQCGLESLKESNRLTTQEFIEKAISIHGERYNYSKVNYIKNSLLVTIICSIHGKFEQKPVNHLLGNGCQKCAEEIRIKAKKGKKRKTNRNVYKHTTESYIEKAKQIHKDKYDYSLVDYKLARDKIIIICPIHGKFKQVAYAHLNGYGCNKCAQIKRSSPLTNEQFIKRAQKTHGNLYDYSKSNYTSSISKVEIICQEHGSFWQEANGHMQGYGCPICRWSIERTRKYEWPEILKRCKEIHGDKYDYSQVKYTVLEGKIKVICPQHGEFFPTAKNHVDNKSGCPACAKLLSAAELEIFEFVKSMDSNATNANWDLIKSPDGNPQQIDIYSDKHKIAVEYCGLYWHSENGGGKVRNYHRDKMLACKEKGIRLVTVFEDEWLNHKTLVMSKLRNIFGLNTIAVYARDCIIEEVDSKTARQFLEKTHLQGYVGCKIRYGLFHNGHLVSIMTFAKPSRAKGRTQSDAGEYELSRFASSVRVIGGAGKLLKHFQRNNEWSRIYSYADLRWSDGNLYEKLGFDRIKDSAPNYWYMAFPFKMGDKRIHRFALRKNKDDNPNLTEWENRKLQKYDRIWDCGNAVYEIINLP